MQVELSRPLRLELIACANAMADSARPETLRHFRAASLRTDNKFEHGFDPVTQADRAAEQAMRAVLAVRRPDDGILGEEFDPVEGTSGLTWVLDPIDGTRGYVSGTPTWGMLIAVNAGGPPILGLIDQPYINERFIGGFGEARLVGPAGPRKLAVRAGRQLRDAILFSTFPEVGSVAERRAFEKLRDSVMLTRYGMDCYAYALLAMGQIDVIAEAGLFAYDVQAPIALIKAAGGVVTNWQGGPAHGGGQILAAGSRDLHAAAMAVLNN